LAMTYEYVVPEAFEHVQLIPIFTKSCSRNRA
jgi:hypothetical protein